MTLTGSKMKIEMCDLPSSPLGESLLILDADFKLDVFSSLRVGVGSVDSATLSVSSGSGSAEEDVVERESGVLSLSWTTYSTMGMLSAEKGKERGGEGEQRGVEARVGSRQRNRPSSFCCMASWRTDSTLLYSSSSSTSASTRTKMRSFLSNHFSSFGQVL